MAKIDKTGDAAIMPLHKILMKMCGQTGYTPDAVKLMVNRIDMSALEELYKVTKDRRI